MSYETGRGVVFVAVALGGFFWILGSGVYRYVRRRYLIDRSGYGFRDSWETFVDMALTLVAATAWLLAIVWIYTPEAA